MALNALGLGLLFTAKDLASGVIQGLKENFTGAHGAADKFAASSKQAFKEFGIGAAMMGAGIAGLAALQPAINSARDFGKEISLVTTEVDEATFAQKDMKKIALEMAQTYGKMPVEEAQAMFDVVGFGANTAESATQALTAANKLAVAGNTDVKTSISAVVGTMNAYNLTADKTGDISDSFFKAMTLGKTTVAELAHAMPKATGAAASLGIEYDTLLAATATLTSRNVQADVAITGLKAAMANILKPTSDAAAEAQRLGIKFDAATVRSKGLPAVLKEIMSNGKFTQDTFVNLFGSVEASNAILQLTSGNMETFSSNLNAMKDRTGATQNAFDKMSATLQFSEDKFGALLEVSKIMIGEALIPIAKVVTDVGSSIMRAFQKIPAPMRDFLVKGFAVASALTAVVGGLLMAKAAVTLFGIAMAKVGAGAAGGMVAALGPVLLVVGAVTIAVLAFKKAIDLNLGGVGEAFRDAWDGIKLSFEALQQLFTDGGFSGAVRDEFKKGENPFINFAIKVYLIVNRIKNFLGGIADGFDAAMKAAQPAFDAFNDALQELGQAFGTFSNDTAASGKAFDAFGAKGFSVGEAIGQVATIIVNAMTIGMQIITGFLSVWDMIAPAVDELGGALGEIFSTLGEVIGALTGASTSGASAADVFKMVGAIIGDVLHVAIKLVTSAIRMFGSIFKSTATTISGVVDVIAGILTGDWARVWNGAKEVVLGVFSSIVDMAMLPVQAIADAVDALASLGDIDLGLGKKLSGFRDSLKGGAKDFLEVAPTGATSGMTTAPVSPPIRNVTPTATTSPALALYQGTSNAPWDPNMFAAPMAAAVSKMPPQQTTTHVTFQVGEDVIARAVAKSGSGSRDFTPASPEE